ncbi:hypothetical protein [Arthrobacter sp. H35-D1]|uniref:hypothetical protein n=1 Tax=Arthrobacter sp. H35-D1 TaxID=3046202 RepID=UPI0024BAEDB5|nr:hypothetical protein [Arthrobacter sp. H35-D1]MDJ0313294.1 hypothetical protein [Arthrobacter sp. H35-D1]
MNSAVNTRINTPVRIVIADDHPLFLYGLRAALAAASELVVKPAMVPGGPGRVAITGIRAAFPEIGLPVLTMHADDDAVRGAIRVGAGDYLPKGVDGDETVRVVLTVVSGGTVFGSGVGRRTAGYLADGTGPAASRCFA